MENKASMKKPIIIVLGVLAFCAVCILVGVNTDTMLLTWVGFFFLSVLLAIAISILKDVITTKRKTEEEKKEMLAKTSKNSGKIAAAVLIGAAVLSFLLTGLVMDSVVIGDGANSGSSKNYSRVCKSCDREFTDASNRRKIAESGMCKNCYNNFMVMSQFIDEEN